MNDKITLKDALENPVWMMVYVGEPQRQVDVTMTYADLLAICHMAERAEQIVRCRDCRHMTTDGDALYCRELDAWEIPPDGFCHRGVKKA